MGAIATTAVGGAVLALAAMFFAWARARSLHRLLRQAEKRVIESERRYQDLWRPWEQGEPEESPRAGSLRTRDQQDHDRFFDLSIDLLVVASFEGYFHQLNPSWARVLGFSLDEIRARPFLELIHPDDRELTQREMQRLRIGGRSVDFENRFLGRDGAYRWLSWRAVALADQERIYAVARDVSDRKKLDQIKNDFISVVSHELRTPLTSIRGSLGLLAGGVAGEIPEKARGLIEIAAKNSDRLVRLINDILDVEKVESGSMNFRFQRVDIAVLLHQAVESNQAYATPFSVRFEVISALREVGVRADPDRLLQVLANLLSNAAKFSPRGGQVDVALERHSGRVTVSVTDRGKGIPPDFHHRIFERFAQADASSTRQKGGTGLGLAISKAIIERHGGRIGFETRPDFGTTFYFDLPEWGVDVPLVETPLSGPRLLVCEDDRDIALLLRLMLEREGYQVEIAANAAEAKHKLRAGGFAAITLDLLLPDQDGLSLLRDLRGLEETRQLPVVVVSARAEQGRVEWQGGALGVLDWLAKPVDPRRLSLAVRRAVAGAADERPRILHVEDDLDLQEVVAAIVGETAEVLRAVSLLEARQLLAQWRFDLVILDLVLLDGSGLELLPLLGSVAPPTPVILFSAHEVSEEVSRQVASVLVKSQTSNRQLLETVQVSLGRELT
jgi:PAS domain S-box-containing protein